MKKLKVVNKEALNQKVNENITKACWLTDYTFCGVYQVVGNPICQIAKDTHKNHSKHTKGSC